MKPNLLNYWRQYFKTANRDVFDIIDGAIVVATSDCPQGFKLRRDQIAERLFSSRLARCSGCERVEQAEPSEDAAVVRVEDENDELMKNGIASDVDDQGVNNGSKVNSTGSKNLLSFNLLWQNQPDICFSVKGNGLKKLTWNLAPKLDLGMMPSRAMG